MGNQVDNNIKEKRSKILMGISDKYQQMYNDEIIGKEVEVLVEEEKNGYLQGHTKNFVLAKIEKNGEYSSNMENKIVMGKCRFAEQENIVI